MNFKKHQPKPESFAKKRWNVLLRAKTGIVFVPCWLAVCCLLLGANRIYAGQPKFANFPEIFNPETNILKASMANGMQTNAAGYISQGGTNYSVYGVTNMAALDDKYRLATGDRLSYRILEDEEDPKPLFVTDSGDIEFPYVGRIPAVGRTCKELARALKVELEKDYYYQATVLIAVDLMKSHGKVYLVGAVRLVGPQEIPSDEVFTLGKAILRAGGFTDFADKRHVKVTRKVNGGINEDRIFTVNVAEILEKGKRGLDLPLQADDLIFIPERLIRF